MKGVFKTMIAGAIIIGIGIAVLLIALGLNGWTLSPDWQTEEYTSAPYAALDVRLNAGKLKVEYHDGENIQVTYPTAKGYETTFTSVNNKLSIEGNKHKWYTFTWGVTIPETVVRIPRDSVTDISVTLNAGTLELPDGSFKNVSIKVNAGTCSVGDITGFDEFKIDVNAGAVNVNGANGVKLSCDVNAGVANINAISCNETDVEVSAGSANIAFNGVKANYFATVTVSAGKCNGLSSQGSALGGDLRDKINIKVSAGSCNVNFLG